MNLDRLTNRDRQPVLGLSGYAERRSVVSNDTAEGKALNRRIDLRFIMVPPEQLEPVRETEERLGL
jgi:flagellar motor protein MotB